MKKRLLSTFLVLCLTLTLVLSSGLTVSAAPEANFAPATKGDNEVAYAVEGGNIYFDPKTGTITGCDNSVTSANIPSAINGVAVTSIGERAFVAAITSSNYYEITENEKLVSVTIPNSVKSIDFRAFYNCTKLTNLTIGNGVTSIGEYAFDNCKSLTSVMLPDGMTSIGASAFSDCESLTSVTIPDSVTTLGNYAFKNCTGLTSATIGNNVTCIGEFSFYNCENLANVTIGYSVTSIGKDAFYCCKSLTSVTLPASLTYIQYFAFADCTSLTSVYFLGDAPEIDSGAFRTFDIDTFQNINIPGLTLYFIEGKKGWTTPTYGEDNLPTAIWQDAPDSGIFSDVKGNEWYAEAVEYAVSNSLMNGMGNNKFEPETAMNRAMLVTVLWRYAGSPEAGESTFTDLTQDWYIPAIAWAAEKGIVVGMSDNLYAPDLEISREQLATVLYRYCNSIGIDTSARADLSTFPDAEKVSAYAEDALSWAVAVGLVTGTQEGSKIYLDPLGNATRAQVATILMRYIENVLK